MDSGGSFFTRPRSGFATWFFQLKSNLLAWEIRHSGEAAYTWEKKGAQLHTTVNILKCRELRTATNRIFNQIDSVGGKCVYVGLEKYSTPEDHDAKRLYLAVLRETNQGEWINSVDDRPNNGCSSSMSKKRASSASR